MIELAELRVLPPLSLATAHTDVLSGHHSFLPHERISGCTVRSRQSFMGKELVIVLLCVIIIITQSTLIT